MKTFILNGRNNDVIREYMKLIPFDGTYKMEIKKVQSKRSLAQNDLYWMWLTIIANDIGYTKDEMHDVMRDMLLEPVVKEVMGRVISTLPSTTDMGVKDFCDYLNAIDIWAAGFGIILPQPEELYYLALGYHKRKKDGPETKAISQQQDT